MRAGELIVFYGSLRPPYATRERLGIGAMVERVGPATLRGALHDLGRYPAYVAGPGLVAGDLYRVVDDRLATVLDPFEGFDSADPARSPYVRERVELVTPQAEAWVYRYTGRLPGDSMVPGGDWVAYLTERGRSGTLGPSGGP